MIDLDRLKENGSPFWRFSLSLYARPHVPSACLVLQDNHGLDVNVLLYLLWAASEGRALSASDIKALNGLIEPWRQQVVVPLRQVRRWLKMPDMAFADLSQDLRTHIKAAELESERIQQEVLYGYADITEIGTSAQTADAISANITAYQNLLHTTFDAASLNVLLTECANLKDKLK